MIKSYLFFITFFFTVLVYSQNQCDVKSNAFITRLTNYGQLFADEYGSDKVIDKQAAAATEMLAIKSKCLATFKEKQIDHCFKNIFEFSREIEKVYAQTGGTESFDMTENYKTINKKAIELPKEFKDGLPGNWKEIAEKKNWKYLEYRSRTVANPPHGQYSRILFSIEIDGIDQWIQFTVPDPEKPGQPTLIDVIGMEKENPKIGLEKSRINFAQYQRDSDGKKPRLATIVDACYRCHATGMRQLNPAVGSFEGQSEVVQEFNKKMESYGNTDWSKFIDVQKLGPHFGDNQNCVSCHNNHENYDNSPRGGIHYLFNPRHIEHKMLSEVSMSPGTISSEDEKKLRSTLAKMQTLPKEKRDKYYEKDRTGNYEEALAFLKNEKVITESEYTTAANIYRIAYHENKKKVDTAMVDYKLQIKKWLAGDTLKCANDKKGEPQSNSGSEGVTNSGSEKKVNNKNNGNNGNQ